MRSQDVVVVGGGVIGSAIAWRAAVSGFRVTLVDDDAERSASEVAAGMLAPVTEAEFGEESLLRLNVDSSERYPGFVAELEELTMRSVGYRRSGTLMVARDADDNAVLDRVFRFQRELGLEVARLRGSEARDLEPMLSPRVRGGILVDGDHQVDPAALLDALREACKRSSVALHGGRVVRIEIGSGRATAVTLATGESLSCDVVVLAAGCRSGSIEGLPPEATPPVRPVKGQLLQLRGERAAPIAGRNIRGLDAYVVVRADGRVVIGATVEEQGFDTRITAGAVHELLRAGHELLPGITELEFVEAAAGLRPGTPDNAPVIGEAMAGLVIATGHFRNGVLLAPATAEAVTQLLATGTAPDAIAAFSPLRFGRDAR